MNPSSRRRYDTSSHSSDGSTARRVLARARAIASLLADRLRRIRHSSKRGDVMRVYSFYDDADSDWDLDEERALRIPGVGQGQGPRGREAKARGRGSGRGRESVDMPARQGSLGHTSLGHSSYSSGYTASASECTYSWTHSSFSGSNLGHANGRGSSIGHGRGSIDHAPRGSAEHGASVEHRASVDHRASLDYRTSLDRRTSFDHQTSIDGHSAPPSSSYSHGSNRLSYIPRIPGEWMPGGDKRDADAAVWRRTLVHHAVRHDKAPARWVDMVDWAEVELTDQRASAAKGRSEKVREFMGEVGRIDRVSVGVRYPS